MTRVHRAYSYDSPVPIYEGMAAPGLQALGATEVVSDRPFTAVELVDRDVSVLHGMLDDLVRILAEADAGDREIVAQKRVAWQVGGLARRLLICDEQRLRAHPSLCVVGFFGERRTELDIGPLEQANSAIVRQFTSYPGILSYSSVELPEGHWANMVLHDDPIDTEYWRRGALHVEAVRLSPAHYRNVRIHNARLTAGVLMTPGFTVSRVKYYDYSSTPAWRAERTLAG